MAITNDGKGGITVENRCEAYAAGLTIGFSAILRALAEDGKITQQEAEDGASRAVDLAAGLVDGYTYNAKLRSLVDENGNALTSTGLLN